MRNPHACVPNPSEFKTPEGSCIHLIRESRFNGKTLELKTVGQENIQDIIDSYGPYTDLNYMLTRLANGDTTVLAPKPAMYGDVSFFPDNPVDAINLIKNAEAQFATLSAEEQLACNNDWKVWFTNLLSAPDPAPDPAPTSGGDTSD